MRNVVAIQNRHTYIIMDELLSSFKNYLFRLGYSKGTVKMLPALAREFIEQQCITDASYIEQEQVKSFYHYLHTRPLKRRSGALSEMMIHHYVYALKTFFNWLEVSGQADYNPISGMKFQRPQQHQRQPLTIAEVQQLFAAVKTTKEKAVLHLFYSCGLRRSEGETLNTGDVQLRRQLLYVRQGKGAKRRVVPLTASVAADLEKYYLEERTGSAAIIATDTEAFVLNRIGSRMKGDQFNSLLHRLTQRAGIEKDITLHHLRHSIATHLLQSGMNMESVRDFLGHRFLETTQIYAKAKPEQIKSL